MKAFYSRSHGCLVLFWRTLAVKEEAETPLHTCKEPLIIYSEYNILNHTTSSCGQQTKRTPQHFVFRNDKNTFLNRKVRATPRLHPVLRLVLSTKSWSADEGIPNFLAQRTLYREKSTNTKFLDFFKTRIHLPVRFSLIHDLRSHTFCRHTDDRLN